MDLAVCWNMCVEERGEERYCWRAGVMSRDEGEWRRGNSSCGRFSCA